MMEYLTRCSANPQHTAEQESFYEETAEHDAQFAFTAQHSFPAEKEREHRVRGYCSSEQTQHKPFDDVELQPKNCRGLFH